jgi:tetratricopeptide (TPR) repeat protein
MRHFNRVLLVTSLTLLAQTAWSAPMPSSMAPTGGTAVPGTNVPGWDYGYADQLAGVAANDIYFRSGLIHLRNAIAFEGKRDLATDAKGRERFGKRAKDDFIRARQSFQYAIKGGDNNLSYVPGAWANIAYIDDRLGDHPAALAASERALALSPQLGVALENRGEALIGLNRVADAKQQYLDLYPSHAHMASLLLTTMKQWSQEQRASGNTDTATVDELDQWIRDREQIAQGRAAR